MLFVNLKSIKVKNTGRNKIISFGLLLSLSISCSPSIEDGLPSKDLPREDIAIVNSHPYENSFHVRIDFKRKEVNYSLSIKLKKESSISCLEEKLNYQLSLLFDSLDVHKGSVRESMLGYYVGMFRDLLLSQEPIREVFSLDESGFFEFSKFIERRCSEIRKNFLNTSPASMDVLALLRQMPQSLKQQIPLLMLDRKGDSTDAFMRTENFLGHVEPAIVYAFDFKGFKRLGNKESFSYPTREKKEPAHVVLEGEWKSSIDLSNDQANIFGGSGSYIFNSDKENFVIPVANCTAEHLAFYTCELIPVGGQVRFEATEELPVSIMEIGKDYPKDYLLRPELGGGAYIEEHDKPHFHMPLSSQAKGYLVVGKRDELGREMLSAFRVPFGYAVYMAPWVIHTDAFLEGRYMVIYSATPAFSTVILRKKNGELVGVKIAGDSE